jgi:hypothetical protein
MIDISYETDDLVIKIPKGIASSAYIQEFLERLRVDAILAESAATEDQIRALADEIDSDWWSGNRARFIAGATDRNRSSSIPTSRYSAASRSTTSCLYPKAAVGMLGSFARE